MQTNTCNQCGEQLKRNVLHDLNMLAVGFNIYYCINPECPNFSLLQIPEEEIIENE